MRTFLFLTHDFFFIFSWIKYVPSGLLRISLRFSWWSPIIYRLWKRGPIVPKRKVYFRKNLKTKIRWHSWLNPKVSIKEQSDNQYIFSKTRSRLHKGFREFHRHFKLLQSLESEFLAEFAKRPVRNDFFLSPIKWNWKFRRNKSWENLCGGYDYFDSRRLGHGKESKKLINGKCPHPDTATAWGLGKFLERRL